MMANSYSLASVMSIEKSRNLKPLLSTSICGLNELSALAAAAFDFAGAVDCFLYDRVAFVINRRRTGDGDVQLIRNVEIDLRNAFAVDHRARGVKVVHVDVAGARTI